MRVGCASLRVWPVGIFSEFSCFLSKNFGGFFDFGAVALRKIRKIMVIFARKSPIFPGIFRKKKSEISEISEKKKRFPKFFLSPRKKTCFFYVSGLWRRVAENILGENFPGKFPKKRWFSGNLKKGVTLFSERETSKKEVEKTRKNPEKTPGDKTWISGNFRKKKMFFLNLPAATNDCTFWRFFFGVENL